MTDWMDTAEVGSVAAMGAAAFLYRSALRRRFVSRRPALVPALVFLGLACALFSVHAAWKPRVAAPVAMIVAVGALVGAVVGVVATPRKASPWWAVAAAPVVAGLVNAVAFAVGDRLWRHTGRVVFDRESLLREVEGLAVGVGVWGAVPAALAALAFQTHRRWPAPRRDGGAGDSPPPQADT